MTSALHRLRASQDVLKFNDGWALAELYPENLRTRIAAQDAKPKKVAKKRATNKAEPRPRSRRSRKRLQQSPAWMSVLRRISRRTLATGSHRSRLPKP